MFKNKLYGLILWLNSSNYKSIEKNNKKTIFDSWPHKKKKRLSKQFKFPDKQQSRIRET